LYSTSTNSAAATESETISVTDKGVLKRDRYVATNRFAVRKGQAAKFEKRWATRKSRLATLDGFRYFHLMRRVKLPQSMDDNSVYDEGDDDTSSQGNYVSFTIWEKKSDFSAWRNGEAFKEAHGGTSIGAFVTTMVSSLFVLRGPPRPAFYDGLLLQSTTPDSIPDIVDGWRQVEADGVTTLPTECFIACNQFFISSDNTVAFEQKWANRKSMLSDCDGFVAFTMLRRDGQQKGHGTVPVDPSEPNYISTTIWKSKAAFDKWRTGNAFRQAHGQGKTSADKETSSTQDQQSKPLWNRPPVPVFYEGTMVITSPTGA
jgi:heme-degrading monooxygenase HmoA